MLVLHSYANALESTTELFSSGGFYGFLVIYSTLLHLPPSNSTVSEDAGIEPKTVANVSIGYQTF